MVYYTPKGGDTMEGGEPMTREEFAMLLESILLLLENGQVEEVKTLIRKRLKSIDGE